MTQELNKVKLNPHDDGILELAGSRIYLLRVRSSDEPFHVEEGGVIVAKSKSATQALAIAVGRYHQLMDFQALLEGKELPSRQKATKGIAERRQRDGVDKKVAAHATTPPNPA